MEQYCLYLRKSRADAEAEARGEGETLARHRKALLDFAASHGLTVAKEYAEIVTGETISARPMMQQLLADVGAGLYAGVLVMEVERLARGDTSDQGLVAQTFKFSSTKIVTPLKTYDPNDEFDEEYFEFGLYMSRREYKTINRRLQRGRIASVKEGRALTNRTPYGYTRQKLNGDKGHILVPQPEEADVVKMIYDWYIDGMDTASGRRRAGVYVIARTLNEMGVKPRTADAWTAPTIQNILHNPAYIGKIRWNWRPATKRIVDGKVTASRPRSQSRVMIVDGQHQPLISQAAFDRAQELMSKFPPPPVGSTRIMANPLAGLVICQQCGRVMQRVVHKKNGAETLICHTHGCDNASSILGIVEQRILDALAVWVKDYKLLLAREGKAQKPASGAYTAKALARLEAELQELEKQRSGLHDLLERGIYDADTFMARSAIVAERISAAAQERDVMRAAAEAAKVVQISRAQFVPRAEEVLKMYGTQTSAAIKNEMLKSVLEKVEYKKERSDRWHSPDAFEIKLYPKLPSPQE